MHILAYSEASHDNFIGLVKRLVVKSRHKLHIIVVSSKKLVLTEHFDSFTVKGLELEASVALLDKLAPAIATDNLTSIAELVDGCPLALKVVGKLLHIYGESLTGSLKTELMKVLDEPSVKTERFSAIMDMAFDRLRESKKCGYILRFFPGSFDKAAGTAVIKHDNTSGSTCLNLYTKYSLLEDYSYAYQRRYMMHRLIKEYLQEKTCTRPGELYYQDLFNASFRDHFVSWLLSYARKQEEQMSTVDAHSMSYEFHNIMYLTSILLRDKHPSVEELAVLAFIANQDLLQMTSLREYYGLYIVNIKEISARMTPSVYSDFYSRIVKEVYRKCECKTLRQYLLNFINSPCMEYFSCTIVQYIMTTPLELPDTIKRFILNRANYNCDYYKDGYTKLLLGPIFVAALFHYTRHRLRLTTGIPSLRTMVSSAFAVMYFYHKSSSNGLFQSIEPWCVGASAKVICSVITFVFLIICVNKVIQVTCKMMSTPMIAIMTWFAFFVIYFTFQPDVYFCKFIPLCQ